MHQTRAGRSSAAPALGGSSSGGSRMPPGHPSNRTKRKAKTNFAKLIDENAVIIISTTVLGTVGGPWELPAEYIGGKYSGGVDKVMESRVNGELVPMLREDGVLWL
ncbi:Glutaredoxin-C9 [Capsicum chinense]|nr:Glutaredoxin-C9 [Capsicum chinense]